MQVYDFEVLTIAPVIPLPETAVAGYAYPVLHFSAFQIT